MLLTVSELRIFLAECVASIVAIKYAEAVVDDSQMANLVSERAIDENLLLFGVIPDYSGDARDEESLMFDNGLDLLLVKKTEDSNLSHSDFLDVMNETLMVVRELVAYVYQKRESDCSGSFYFLKEGSEQIVPVWKKAGTNGWMISFNLRTDL